MCKCQDLDGGVAVQAVEAPNPLQLINPGAPVEYLPSEDNVVRDPITGHTVGWKLLSFSF